MFSMKVPHNIYLSAENDPVAVTNPSSDNAYKVKMIIAALVIIGVIIILVLTGISSEAAKNCNRESNYFNLAYTPGCEYYKP
jgi:hypothetical protein